MEESTFGDRLRAAFGNAKQKDIARKIGVGQSTVVNYFAGRIPEWEIVFRIKEVTGCDLHWLLTGEGKQPVQAEPPSFEEIFEQRVRDIVVEELRARVAGTYETDETDVTIEPLTERDVMLAPVVAHIGPAEARATDREETAEDIRKRLIGEDEIKEIERRVKPRRKAG